MIPASQKPLGSARDQPQVDSKLYESLSSEGGNHSIIVHDGRVHRDGRTIYTNHSRFCLDGVFPQDASNEQVYKARLAMVTKDEVPKPSTWYNDIFYTLMLS